MKNRDKTLLEQYERERKAKSMDEDFRLIGWFGLIIGLIIVSILLITSIKAGKAITETFPSFGDKGKVYSTKLYKALITEAVGEKEAGMYAVACVIRNRIVQGIPLGMKGLERADLDEFVAKQGKANNDIAKRIVREVIFGDAPDTTNGATHFENVESFGIPFWAKDMVICAKIGNHTFYKVKEAK